MRFILLLVFQLLINSSYCQVTRTNQIDSIVNEIERKEYFYRADSIANSYDKDSNLFASSSMEFFYSDKKGKNLFKVDELGFFGDTTSIIYFYKNRQLIKIDFHSFLNGKIFEAELFFNKGRLIGEKRKGDMVYQIIYSTLYDRSKKYLKYKPKTISQNWIN